MIYTRRIPTKTLYNCRDLGGYATKDGGRTRFQVFLRSEMPAGISEEDKEVLHDYGVTVSMDFRATPESIQKPSDFREGKYEWCKYMLVPTYPEADMKNSTERYWVNDTTAPGFNWGKAYITMCQRGGLWVKDALTIAAETEGVLHYHCYTGKDRTGVFSAILLSLAGVDKADIAADYSMSQALLQPFYMEKMERYVALYNEDIVKGLEIPFCQTPPTNMYILLDFIEKNYGDMESFVKSCGVTDEIIEKIRAKFVER